MDKKGTQALHPILRTVANLLAFSLLALFTTYSEEPEYPIAPMGNFVVEVEYNHLDLPTSVSRSHHSKQIKLQRLLFIPASLSFGLVIVQPDLPDNWKPQVSTIHPLIISLLKLVVSSNAP